MQVHDDHLYHGAALIQIAEDKRFTAIKFELKLSTGVSRSAYRINDTIGVYVKYASKPRGAVKEYQFTFLKDHLDELVAIEKKVPNYSLRLFAFKAAKYAASRTTR